MEQAEFLTNCRFYLELQLDDSTQGDAVFLDSQGFTRTQDVIEVCEVTPNQWGYATPNQRANATKGQVVRTKIPGNVRSGNLILRRGMTNSIAFWNWFAAVQNGSWALQRKYLSLTIYDQGKIPQARFELSAAWPVGYEIADVNALGKEVLIEKLEVAFEGFERVPV